MLIEERKPNQKRNCWTRRTFLEKCLFLVILLLLLLIAIIAAVKLINWEPNVCSTQGCVKAANQILSKADLDLDPCDDFYKFTCGNFIRNTIIPPSETLQNGFNQASDLVTDQMRSLLESPVNLSEPRYVSLIKSVYQSCMNKTEIESNSLPYLQLLMLSYGGWPVVRGDQWVPGNFSWTKTSYSFMGQGFQFGFFFEFDVQSDPTNSSRKLLHLEQPFTVPFYNILKKGLNESLVQAYLNYASKIAVAFGADPSRARVEMTEVVQFTIDIARISVPPEERRDPLLSNNHMTIAELQRKYPYVPWWEYINHMLYPQRLDYQAEVIVTVPEYFDRLGNLLSVTSKRVMANYMFWKMLQSNINFLSEKIRDIKSEFNSIASGQMQAEPRWKQCVRSAASMDAAAGALYVKHFFKNESKHVMLEMVENIRYQFKKSLQNLEWMDDSTREHALVKATSMQAYIAYPDELLDDVLVDNYFRNLTINPLRYIQTALNLRRFDNQLKYAELFETVDSKDWRYHADASVSNAFYDQSQNSIEFPAGILQQEFFDLYRPNHMNYGAIGGIIGHEITHGFDDQGRHFDDHGNMVDWWNPETASAFKSRADCIQEQYGNFVVPEVNISLNSNNTQSEDIADNGGFIHAYLAYKKWSLEHPKEPELPGLSYTPEQMFWISLGSTWCEVMREEQLKLQLMNDPHSIQYYRVNVPLMNSDYFARDFNCPVGSFMNPEKKCIVW